MLFANIAPKAPVAMMFTIVGLLFSALLSSVLALPDEILGSEKPRTITVAKSSSNMVIVDSLGQDSDIWFSFFQSNGFTSVRINSTVTADKATKKADFRVTPIRIIEFNGTIPIEQSQNIFEFNGKQVNWGPISLEQFKVNIDKKDTNILRMNATLNFGDFKYTMNVYLADRSCFYGSYNLDPDSAYIVQTIQNFPYKYGNSTIAVEQVVASRDSGAITSYLAVTNSAFLGSLVISPVAVDTQAGQLPVSISDFTEITFGLKTSEMAMESSFENVYIGLGSNQQPKDVTFEEKFSVNIGSVKTDGTEVPYMNIPNNTGTDSSSKASRVSPQSAFLAIVAMLLAIL